LEYWERSPHVELLNLEPEPVQPFNRWNVWNGWNKCFYRQIGGWFPREAKDPASVSDKNHALALTIAGETDENPKYQNTRLDHNALVFRYLASITDSSVSGCLSPSALLIVTTIGTTIFACIKSCFLLLPCGNSSDCRPLPEVC
jgi:hypothetical protein